MTVRKIAVYGLEKKDIIILKASIDTASGFETDPWEHVNNPSEAQAIILDPNSTDGFSLIESLADQNDAPLLIGYTTSNADKQNSLRFMIEHPLNYKNILATLRQIDLLVKNPEDETVTSDQRHADQDRKEQNKLTTGSDTSTESSDQKITEISERKPEDGTDIDTGHLLNYKLHHLIKEVIAENKSVEISHPEFPSIKICSDKGWFIFPEDLDKQEKLFRTRVSEFTVEDKGDEIRRQAFSGSFPKALWELIYTATLLGTEGELSEPLQPEDQLHLIEVPEFDMAPHSEEHVAIADYMVSHSSTVGDVAKNLEVDVSTVIDFCNACQAIGLMIVSGEPQNRLFRLINRIIEQKKSVEITHPDYPPIEICSVKDWFIFPKDLNQYTEMFCIDAGEFSFENRGDEIRKQAFGGTFPKSLWELVYTATMFGTEGKLLKPLRATDRMSLIKKPEFEYVIHTKQHLALADYMVQYTDTVHDIAVNTGVEILVVIDFCNMCQSINLLERNSAELKSCSDQESVPTEETARVPENESKASKLIHSLLSNLKDQD